MPSGPATARISAPWLTSPTLRRVVDVVSGRDETARVVGGAVRNALLGLPIGDIDIATTAHPDVVMQRAASAGLRVHPTGKSHGTVTVTCDGTPFEVTTLRRDIETDGRHARVAFTRDWKQDALRRDFTINALYADLDGTVHDFAGGIADLSARRVRFIGNADERIREDYLRILRFFRFTAEYAAGPPDADGLDATRRLRDGLATLSAERIWNELRKLLAAPRAAEVVAVMEENGILQLVLGTTPDTARFARLTAVETTLGTTPDSTARLAALAIARVSDVAGLAERLRLSRAEQKDLEAAASTPDLNPKMQPAEARAAIYKLGQEGFRKSVRRAWANSSASTDDAAWSAFYGLSKMWTPPTLPYSGEDVVGLGIAPGPAVGRILKEFEAWWIKTDFATDPHRLRAELERIARLKT